MYPLVSNKLVFIGEGNCYSYSIINIMSSTEQMVQEDIYPAGQARSACHIPRIGSMEIDLLGERPNDLILSLNPSQLLCINKITDFSSISHLDFSDYNSEYLTKSDYYLIMSIVPELEATIIGIIKENFELPNQKYSFVNSTDINGVSGVSDIDVYHKCNKLNLLINDLNNLSDLMKDICRVKSDYGKILANEEISYRRKTFLKYVIAKNDVSLKTLERDLANQHKKIVEKLAINIKKTSFPEFAEENKKYLSDYIPDLTHSSRVYKSCQSYYNRYQTVSYTSANLSRQPTMQGMNFGLM